MGEFGKYVKAREFGYNGQRVKDIEFTDHGRPHDHTCPHQHKANDNASGGTKMRDSAQPVEHWNYKNVLHLLKI